MDLDRLTTRLSAFPDVVAALMAPIPAEDARWRPPEGGWSLLEIVWHLAEEEILDFRTRMELTLEDPAHSWPPIDPEGDILREEYNERDPVEALATLRTERGATVAWLRRLEAPNWDLEHHSEQGDLTAGDILAALVCHDALHLRQLARRLYDLGVRDCGGFSPEYAGPW